MIAPDARAIQIKVRPPSSAYQLCALLARDLGLDSLTFHPSRNSDQLYKEIVDRLDALLELRAGVAAASRKLETAVIVEREACIRDVAAESGTAAARPPIRRATARIRRSRWRRADEIQPS